MNRKKLFDACDDITLEIIQNLERGETHPLSYSYELYRYHIMNQSGTPELFVVRDSEEDILIVHSI